MSADRSHLGPDDIAVGLDLGSQGHQAVILASDGRRLTSFRVDHSRAGLAELVRRATPERWHARRAVYAFERPGISGKRWPMCCGSRGSRMSW